MVYGIGMYRVQDSFEFAVYYKHVIHPGTLSVKFRGIIWANWRKKKILNLNFVRAFFPGWGGGEVGNYCALNHGPFYHTFLVGGFNPFEKY